MNVADRVTQLPTIHSEEDAATAALALENPSLTKRIADVLRCTNVQRQPGNAHSSEYMRGMANGMTFCSSALLGIEPEYINEPPNAKTLDREQIRRAVNALGFDARLNFPDMQIAEAIFAKAEELARA